ncbi:MAG: GGDEF domain-containing protein [Spirochaetes bacterium]|nr:GGDEF domain-containing protein [Spirochaetota bacterium]
MKLFDMRTVIYSFSISNLITMVVMVILWNQNRKRYSGIGYWMADYIMQFIALVLISLRGIIPNLLSMTVSNALIIGGTILIYMGFERFTDKRSSQIHNFILLILFIISHSYFVFIINNLTIRNILFSIALFIISAQCTFLLLWRVRSAMYSITRGVGFVYAAYCIVSIARIIFDLTFKSGIDFFRSNIYDTTVLMIYQMLFILHTFFLFLMVNSRLFSEVKKDIESRKETEKIIRLRLRIWEYAVTHTLKELMQKALDEIEELTGSLIGFYHFVDENEKSLTLQAWSTRTKAVFCKAEGEGMHYSIAEAGVWVDCIHQRKPVIHNDYSSLPHKKGMPEGHAKLIRELVVPTIRDGKIVSILGIGNKPSDYNEKDVELVSYIADIVWTIVSQKKAEEQIHQLNDQLEHLAMTDELTSLANRRAFFILGGDEIKRARRYHSYLTLIMFDIDRFKQINDTYGHEAGDTVLQCITKTIKESTREVDIAARLGGEEFGILLPHTKSSDAVKLAERLRLSIETKNCKVQNKRMKITASFGVADFNNEMPDLDALLRDADTAMYKAKKQGRNKVVYIK